MDIRLNPRISYRLQEPEGNPRARWGYRGTTFGDRKEDEDRTIAYLKGERSDSGLAVQPNNRV